MNDWEKELRKIFDKWWDDNYRCGVKDCEGCDIDRDIEWEGFKRPFLNLLTKERQKMAKALRKEIIEWKNNQKQDTSFKYEILMAEAGGIGDAVNFILEAIDSYLKKQEGK